MLDPRCELYQERLAEDQADFVSVVNALDNSPPFPEDDEGGVNDSKKLLERQQQRRERSPLTTDNIFRRCFEEAARIEAQVQHRREATLDLLKHRHHHHHHHHHHHVAVNNSAITPSTTTAIRSPSSSALGKKRKRRRISFHFDDGPQVSTVPVMEPKHLENAGGKLEREFISFLRGGKAGGVVVPLVQDIDSTWLKSRLVRLANRIVEKIKHRCGGVMLLGHTVALMKGVRAKPEVLLDCCVTADRGPGSEVTEMQVAQLARLAFQPTGPMERRS